MELIRISDQKLKIMLTPMDMSHFELDSDSFGEDSAQMHRSFRLLLTEVRRQTDFDADDSHISVQYFPSIEGGCEMFICNLSDADGKKEANDCAIVPAEKSAVELRPYKKRNGSFRKDCAWRFSCLDHLLRACRRLKNCPGVLESSAWRDEGGDYFLVFTILSVSPYSTPDDVEFLLEYAIMESAPHLWVYIREHAAPICIKNAVWQLAELS